MSWRGSHTRMSSCVKPMASPVLRPRCWSGKNSTCSASPSRSAHSSTARALVDVHTAPPWRPTNAFSAADEFMYVIGTSRSMSVTVAELLPRLLDLVEVGHVGHRAAGVEVREDDLLVVGGEDVSRLGHEVHAAEHDVLGFGALLRQHRQAVRVATGVGPLHHLVALVVVAEDEHAITE